jgi:hypothetical protein
MFVSGTLATGVTLSLIVVFGGIGVLVNVLIFYTVVQVMGEHRENEKRKLGDDG